VAEGLLMIGQFSQLTRLSPKALRLYDELGLVRPVRIDPVTGYRWYARHQVEPARLVGLLRQLDLPLAQMPSVLGAPGAQAAQSIRAHVESAARQVQARAALAAYICRLLEEGSTAVQGTDEVLVRSMPARAVLIGSRHVHIDEAGAVLGELLGRMRSAAPG
jgi:DNA-binding transcriptional MerR regulator